MEVERTWKEITGARTTDSFSHVRLLARHLLRYSFAFDQLSSIICSIICSLCRPCSIFDWPAAHRLYLVERRALFTANLPRQISEPDVLTVGFLYFLTGPFALHAI